MWNRVVLLTCGMALGWGLANYWSAPWAEIGKHRYRLAASAGVGLLLTAVLAWQDLRSGLIALAILAGTAAISYAANAKQLGKPAPRVAARPETPLHTEDRPAIVLVADAEPQAYTGPSPWAERLRSAPTAQSVTPPHWLLRPYLCHRIRRAYREMPAGPPSWQRLTELAAHAQERLGERAVVRLALCWGEPSLSAVLHNLTQDGHRRIVILPIDLQEAAVVDLRQAVVETRIREAGILVELLPGHTAGLWGESQRAANLDALARGMPPKEPVSLPSATVAEVVAVLEERL